MRISNPSTILISSKIIAGRFYTLLDPTFAKEHLPLISSVAEHQPTAWASFFLDFHVLTILFPAGIYYCLKAIKEGDRKADAKIFVLVYAVTSIYFAGVLIRLILLAAPAACILGAVAITSILDTHIPHLHPPKKISNLKGNHQEIKSKDDKKDLFIQRELSYIMVEKHLCP